MKYNMSLMMTLVLVVGIFWATNATAQTYQTNGGLIVVDENLLSGEKNHKQIVFVVAKDIFSAARIEFETYSSEGIVNHFTPLQFPTGLHKGLVIPMWNGDLNSFHNTPWLYFRATVFTTTDTYYSESMLPVRYRELYKEPMITSIAESGGYGIPYTITVKGIFDTTIPSMILINSGVFVSPKTVTQIAPGIIKFDYPDNSFAQFPSGKYLLTICQEGHCDTMTGRHR